MLDFFGFLWASNWVTMLFHRRGSSDRRVLVEAGGSGGPRGLLLLQLLLLAGQFVGSVLYLHLSHILPIKSE